ncbi:MAG: alpha-L-glutamate ligase, partial [Pseudomonadota bacterium]|nr:alpha-L-glutamate ligase [Pseudomonadota bacterium]
MPADLAILYEHPSWFEPLFTALERRGIAFRKVVLTDHGFDPVQGEPPAAVILSRVAMSGFLRDPDHGIFYAQALLGHWERLGATVLNGPEVLAIDSSKARQLSLISSLGHAVPVTHVVHRPADLVAASADLAFPLLVKANIGGSGAGIARYGSREELERSVADGTVPQ